MHVRGSGGSGWGAMAAAARPAWRRASLRVACEGALRRRGCAVGAPAADCRSARLTGAAAGGRPKVSSLVARRCDGRRCRGVGASLLLLGLLLLLVLWLLILGCC